jgi:hypothetical protein
MNFLEILRLLSQGIGAGLAKLDSPISDKKSLFFLAQSAQKSNDETTQKKSHGRF